MKTLDRILLLPLLLVFAVPTFQNPRPTLLFYALILILIVLSVSYAFVLRYFTRALECEIAKTGDSEKREIFLLRLRYRRILVKVTSVWLSSAVVLVYSIYVSKSGLGSDWLPFARFAHIGKSHPLYLYTLFDGPIIIAGFLFISGIVWMPMYYFFEGLVVKQKTASILKGETAHA